MKNDKAQFVVRTSDFYLSLFICHLSFDRKRVPACEGFSCLAVQICVHLWFHEGRGRASSGHFANRTRNPQPGLHSLRPLPPCLSHVPAAGKRSGFSARPYLPDEGRRRGPHISFQRHLRKAHVSVPGMPRLRNRLSFGRQVLAHDERSAVRNPRNAEACCVGRAVAQLHLQNHAPQPAAPAR